MIGSRPLPIGLELLGLDLRRPVAADLAEELRRLLATHQLLVIRDQALEPADQIDFGAVFGNVLDEKQDGKRYQYVSGQNTAIAPGRLLFHSDNHHTQVPLEYLTLYAESVDDATATPTLFVDTVAAYQRLSEGFRQRLSEAETVTMTFFHLGVSGRPSYALGDDNAGGPTARHPAIWQHPDTSEPFVYLSELHTNHIVGLARPESDALLERVFETMYDPDHQYEHRWRTGDLVIWNNRTVQHARGELLDPVATGTVPRTVRRVGIGPISFSDQYQFSADTLGEMTKVADNFYVPN